MEGSECRGRDIIYLALYRKYRPVTFRDVFSQEHITTTLQNQIKNKQTVHAYLFTGSRGTGKTSCARILAKALCCLSPEDGNPCLTCEACKSIADGTAQDISEIDAASNNGVDDVRVLREETRYVPVSLKYRVYIIDEVHMLSAGAFNALLKTLEEPPAHVVFILATTENHKVPATILSRCQRFEFKRVKTADCVSELMKIAQKEGVKLSQSAAELIARLSDGGMRDALSLLETCISQSEIQISQVGADFGEITGQVVQNCAGVAGSAHIFGISEAVLTGNTGTALKIITNLHEQSKDMGRLLTELIQHYRNLMLLKLLPDETEMISWLPEEAEDTRALCGRYEMSKIMQCLSVLEEATERISRKGDKRLVTELCVIEMCGEPPVGATLAVARNETLFTPTPQPVQIDVPPQKPQTPGFPPEPAYDLPPEPELPPWQEALETVKRIETGGEKTLDSPVNEVDKVNEKITDFKNLLKQKGIEVRER
ncbi:MAG: DNA polymerase III subunit gamma/tau [Oscillospiraceae bacterium]|nr:DNA polymerase III subunit gamma/tau [Oscillospiraceae bacterium]